ncbi:MAG: TasA family protein [Carboxydocellales bacterium]
MKKKIAMSLATVGLVSSLVGGATFALFTSTAENQGNNFSAGTVVISMDKPDGTKYFDVTNIAPGDSGSAIVKVTNDGSLELRYDIAESLVGVLAGGDNPLVVTIKDAAGNVIVPGTDNNRVLASGADENLTVEWSLPLLAGNEYQGESATLGLTLNAEQTRS